jgi:hypothetical protein
MLLNTHMPGHITFVGMIAAAKGARSLRCEQTPPAGATSAAAGLCQGVVEIELSLLEKGHV